MDESRKDSRQYMLVAIVKETGRIITNIVSEQGARDTEGPHFKAIINH